jgi:apolipoprotein N-acyltransferase
MARIRAIEAGFSVVRAVRWATSAAFDGYGRELAILPVSAGSEQVLALYLLVLVIVALLGRAAPPRLRR